MLYQDSDLFLTILIEFVWVFGVFFLSVCFYSAQDISPGERLKIPQIQIPFFFWRAPCSLTNPAAVDSWRTSWWRAFERTQRSLSSLPLPSLAGGVEECPHGRGLLDHQRGEVRGHRLFCPVHWDRYQRHGLPQQRHCVAIGLLRWGARHAQMMGMDMDGMKIDTVTMKSET